uniref:Uncharacterized protein n=1 Tax=Cannabis sativa TaxID=3483 RepID=A0A803PKT7_CANSA
MTADQSKLEPKHKIRVWSACPSLVSQCWVLSGSDFRVLNGQIESKHRVPNPKSQGGVLGPDVLVRTGPVSEIESADRFKSVSWYWIWVLDLNTDSVSSSSPSSFTESTQCPVLVWALGLGRGLIFWSWFEVLVLVWVLVQCRLQSGLPRSQSQDVRFLVVGHRFWSKVQRPRPPLPAPLVVFPESHLSLPGPGSSFSSQGQSLENPDLRFESVYGS